MIEVTSRYMECTHFNLDFSQMPAVALQIGFQTCYMRTIDRYVLLDQSRKRFGFQNVWTQKRNVFCIFEGKRHRIDDYNNIAKIKFPEK